MDVTPHTIADNQSPIAFQWDAWYAAIGGRKISIPEVDYLLREIHEGQYPRFEGPVSNEQFQFQSTQHASEIIKKKALALGADIVGICRIEPSDVYRGRSVPEKFAIALGQRMDYEKFLTVPSQESAIECLRVYHTLGEVAIQLAEFIRGLGYACRVEHPIGDSDLLHIPIGLKAGFGELGRHGSIIHPELGPLFRMGSVVCDLEMDCDTPIDAGIAAFCDSCRACRIYCPANAIPEERSEDAGKDHLGNPRYLVDTGKCFPYFATHYYCSACLPVCVYNHRKWAKDLLLTQELPFPTVIFDTAPAPVDVVPEDKRHAFPRHKRNEGITIPKRNAIDKTK